MIILWVDIKVQSQPSWNPVFETTWLQFSSRPRFRTRARNPVEPRPVWSTGRGPTGLRARVRNRGRLENRSHVVPKTGFHRRLSGATRSSSPTHERAREFPWMIGCFRLAPNSGPTPKSLASPVIQLRPRPGQALSRPARWWNIWWLT